MSRLLDTLLSSIAPHACVACGTTGALLCHDCTQLLPEIQPRCYKCQKPTSQYETCTQCAPITPLAQVIVTTPYESVAKALVQKLKFAHAYNAAQTIAQVLEPQLAHLHTRNEATLCHLPTATSRVRQRGYDQSQVIARFLARRSAMPYKGLLWRHGQARQTGSTRTERLTQVEHAFSVRFTPSEHVVLIDDVMTTGASLESAAKALRAVGAATVSALVFARAE